MGNKKTKAPPPDGGISPKQAQQLRAAIRQVWSWSHARKLCVKRATTPDGFANCERCLDVVAKVYPDHIEPCGALDEGYLKRMFVASDKLQALCDKCHRRKTRLERAA